MDVVALLVIASTTLGSIVVAVLTLREMARDEKELRSFLAGDRVPCRD